MTLLLSEALPDFGGGAPVVPLTDLVDFHRPPYIALCGWPKVGKSTVAELLRDIFGTIVVDDGRPLRDAGKTLFGLTEHQVTTQEGKASFVNVCGRDYEVRELLGKLGADLEARYGEQFTAEAALHYVNRIRREYQGSRTFVFPSVRRSQGLTYKKAGGLVIEITRKGTTPSPHAFDDYDHSLVDMIIRNDFTNLKDLRNHLSLVMEPYLGMFS